MTDLLSGVSVSSASANILKQGFQNLILSDPEQAKKFLLDMPGQTEETVDALIKETLNAVEEAEVKAALKDTADLIQTSLIEALSSMTMPDEVEKLTVSVKYDASLNAETGEAFGFIVTNPTITIVGSDKAISFGTKSTAGGGGSGPKRTRVKMPEGCEFSSWKAYGVANYPDHEFEGRSAPRELASLGDTYFLEAAAAQGVSYDDDPQGHRI